MSKPIQIWKFSDAPEKYRGYFDSDDADWLALIPKERAEEYIPFLEENTPFGPCWVDLIYQGDGSYLKVGYHA